MTSGGREIEDSLCAGCGMCCDGTLHAKADLEPGEAPSLASSGLELVDEGRAFLLPCPYSKNGCCSVFPARPASVCSSYECKLLKAVKTEELSLESAREKVATAKRMLAGVGRSQPDAVLAEHRSTIWRRLQDELPTLDPPSRQESASVILGIAALDQFLERWFGNKKPKLGTKSSNRRSDEPERC
jgi:uncharacterized protein